MAEEMGRFAFDGAEGIAFHIYSDETQENCESEIMFDDLPILLAFLRSNFPGLFTETTTTDDREALIESVVDALRATTTVPFNEHSVAVIAVVRAVEDLGFRRPSPPAEEDRSEGLLSLAEGLDRRPDSDFDIATARPLSPPTEEQWEYSGRVVNNGDQAHMEHYRRRRAGPWERVEG